MRSPRQAREVVPGRQAASPARLPPIAVPTQEGCAGIMSGNGDGHRRPPTTTVTAVHGLPGVPNHRVYPQLARARIPGSVIRLSVGAPGPSGLTGPTHIRHHPRIEPIRSPGQLAVPSRCSHPGPEYDRARNGGALPETVCHLICCDAESIFRVAGNLSSRALSRDFTGPQPWLPGDLI